MFDTLFWPLAAFAGAAGLLTLTPGVDTAMVLRSAAALGPRAGAAAAVGVAAGLLLWGAGAALGLTAILAASPLAFTALKWIGAAYLMGLGVRLILKPRTSMAAVAAEKRGGARDALRRGFLTNMLNPKVGVFYVTFLPQFIPPGVNVAVFSLLLAGVHVTLSLIWFAALIAATQPLARVLARPAVVKTLDRLTGSVFVAFGVRLAAAERG
jgi:threonine/homoserine/homoserine lactone efflux protein